MSVYNQWFAPLCELARQILALNYWITHSSKDFTQDHCDIGKWESRTKERTEDWWLENL